MFTHSNKWFSSCNNGWFSQHFNDWSFKNKRCIRQLTTQQLFYVKLLYRYFVVELFRLILVILFILEHFKYSLLQLNNLAHMLLGSYSIVRYGIYLKKAKVIYEIISKVKGEKKENYRLYYLIKIKSTYRTALKAYSYIQD